MTITSHAPSYPKAVKSSTVRRQYQRQQRTHREQFTPAQIRQIEREEAQLAKARRTEDREKKRKLAKKKKEEKEAKEREERRKLVREGKLNEEDIWAKCAASQQRLNAFFGGVAGRKRKRDESEDIGRSREGSVASAPAGVVEAPNTEEFGPEPFSSSAPDIMTASITAGQGNGLLNSATAEDKMKDPIATKQRPSEETYQLSQPLDPSLPGSLEFEILDDTSIGTQPDGSPITSKRLKETSLSESTTANTSHRDAESLSSPSKPVASPITPPAATPTKRAVFGEMTASRVNIRASEKPDSISVAPPGSDLPSPSPERFRRKTTGGIDGVASYAQNAAQVLAMICSQDLREENEAVAEEDEDKENKDPWRESSKLTTEGEASKQALGRNPRTLGAKNNPRESPVKPGGSKQALKEAEEAETDYEDIFGYEDVFSSDEEDDVAPEESVHQPDRQRRRNENSSHSDPKYSMAKASNVFGDDDSGAGYTTSTERHVIMVGMKNTLVDVQGSPRKPKPTPPKTAPTPVPFGLPTSTTTPVKHHTPPQKSHSNDASARSAPPKNELSSFGIEGLDEDDFQAFAKTLDDAQIKNSEEGKGKGKGKAVEA